MKKKRRIMVDTAFFRNNFEKKGNKWYIRLPIFLTKHATETPIRPLERARKTVYETIKPVFDLIWRIGSSFVTGQHSRRRPWSGVWLYISFL